MRNFLLLVCFSLLHGCSNFDDEIGLECKTDETGPENYKSYWTDMYLIINKSTKFCTQYNLPLELADNGNIYYSRHRLWEGDYNNYECIEKKPGGETRIIIDRTSLKGQQRHVSNLTTRNKYQLLKCELIPVKQIKSRIDRKVKTFTDKRKI